MEPGCRLGEIVQFVCNLEQDAGGQPQIHCFPLPRIFKLCPGSPAVEITKLVDIDLATGEVVVPPDASSQKLVVKATWKDVHRHEVTDPNER
ncbi:hypothetical protein AGABI1DRAFT_116134 [Agaricus bisporus var. burnettii JB137-S8]|uniref:Uncharacterized protein n=2 Tax=Agaricus bisporus var. burnettii TaxID=192524 RepID=K5WYW5_AGABU|nr:uncharacterized protein AGABI1DRAFT_116134 [Agaricus bisporus var. burnettii JB137-S8]EKM75802.1 hypothetical protein AGABI1DRAFT_116134 [Agaricus bisporus var. burnettii JB137-S8]KAF7761472.1 hypothetical protein Agabi119p4_9464 [Agaricus bisporus var. burnettii]